MKNLGGISRLMPEPMSHVEFMLGNSAIISEKAKKRTLSEEENKNLKTGITIVDLQS